MISQLITLSFQRFFYLNERGIEGVGFNGKIWRWGYLEVSLPLMENYIGSIYTSPTSTISFLLILSSLILPFLYIECTFELEKSVFRGVFKPSSLNILDIFL